MRSLLALVLSVIFSDLISRRATRNPNPALLHSGDKVSLDAFGT